MTSSRSTGWIETSSIEGGPSVVTCCCAKRPDLAAAQRTTPAVNESKPVVQAAWAGLLPFPHVHEMTGDRGGGRHRGRHQVGAPLVALATLEVAVRGRGAALAGRELVWVHGEAHRAARLAPFEAGLHKD